MVTLALLLENQSCDELTDLEISSLVGAGKQPGRMSFHLVLQPSRPTVVLLPPQRIPESICNRGWSVYGSSMCTLVNISPVLPTLLLPLVQKGGGHMQDLSQLLGSFQFVWVASTAFPHPGSRGQNQEENIVGVQTGGGRLHLTRAEESGSTWTNQCRLRRRDSRKA